MSDEITELLQQATEHLRYLRELGVTHVAEPVAAPVIKSNPVEVLAKLPVAKVTMPKVKPSNLLIPEIPPFDQPITDDSIDKIRAELGDCKRCKLWETRTNLVFGEGNIKAGLMFVGEAPGADEDASGRPFVGRAGQLLTKMIEAINYNREDVYIANILKSRPPDNRPPEPDEVAACKPFLLRQIAVIRPKLIVTLGNPATQGLLDTKVGITKLRGLFHDYPRLAGIKVLPTYHPAYLLRSPDKKRDAWEDLKRVRAFMDGKISE